MARIIDITDKLSFDTSLPEIHIKGKVIKVNNDAITMLEVMSLMNSGNFSLSDFATITSKLFPEESKQIIRDFHFNLDDFRTFIYEAIGLISESSEDDEGNDPSDGTTSSETGTWW